MFDRGRVHPPTPIIYASGMDVVRLFCVYAITELLHRLPGFRKG